MALGHWAVEYLGEGNGQGGSGGGGLVVNFTKGKNYDTDNDAEITDKTTAEIKAAIEAGTPVVFNFVSWEDWGFEGGSYFAQSFTMDNDRYNVLTALGQFIVGYSLSGPMYFAVGD